MLIGQELHMMAELPHATNATGMLMQLGTPESPWSAKQAPCGPDIAAFSMKKQGHEARIVAKSVALGYRV